MQARLGTSPQAILAVLSSGFNDVFLCISIIYFISRYRDVDKSTAGYKVDKKKD